MAKHNTQPGRFHRIFVPIPANVAVLRGLLGPLPVGGLTASTGCLPSGGTASPVWPVDASDLAACSWGFALPTRAPPGIELWSFRLLCSPVYRVLMVLKPSPPFSLSCSVACGRFHSLSFSVGAVLSCGGSAFPALSPLSLFSLHKNSSLPSTASLSPSSPLCTTYLPSSVAQVMQIVV